MYRPLPRTLSRLRGAAGGGAGGAGVLPSAFPPARHYATKGPAPPPPKLSFTERLRNKLWRPGALPPADPDHEAEAALEAPPAIAKPTDTPGYVEAVDARALPVVGLDPGPEEWDVPVFITNPRFHHRAAIHRAVHRATIELHTRLLNGLPASSFTSRYTGPEALTPLVDISVSARSAAFTFPTRAVEAAILAAGTADHDAGLELRAYTQDELYPDADPPLLPRGWAGLRLRDQELRFALVKRVAQLTGIRVVDAEASRVGTVAELLEQLETKPRPRKLYEVIAAETSPLPTLPNVKVYETRVRPWDKERMVGRERPFEKAVEFRYPFEVRGGRK